MKPRLALVAALAGAASLVLAGLFGGARVPGAAERGCPRDPSCAQCHEGEMPPSHTPEFFSDRHGEAAHAQAQTCYGCHERTECDECHARKAPLWHGAEVEQPDLGAQHRRGHAALGSRRREDCIACHAQNFQLHCAECHQRKEFP